MKKLNDADVVRIIKAAVVLSNQKTVAKNIGISQQYLCDVLRGRRGLSDKMLAKIGYRRISYIVETKEDK